MSESSLKINNRYFYNKLWEKLYPVKEVLSDPYAFYCIPCSTKYSCAYSGVHSLSRHCDTSKHLNTGTKYKASTVYISPESSLNTCANGNEVETPNTKLLHSANNQPKPFAVASSPIPNGSEKTYILFETLDVPNTQINLENNTFGADLNGIESLEKSKYANDIDRNDEMGSDSNLSTDLSIFIEIDGIKEELNALKTVVKDIENYLRYVF
ncbi:hypothetical protein RF11_10986 [Thelohanellus kitauei]|uniref:Uncharacterized protein n=1 Tax=Thelohanellus kitauei TaxID=669202 RepID=A0A0C2I793_THEKT|nr:hypothetical protein RF11_10986 [Thelohanellus kitauei]